MKKIIAIVALIALVAGCKKAKFDGNNPTGEGLVDFTLIGPATSSSYVLNGATPDATISFSWNAAKPGLNTAPSYQIVFALKSSSDFNSPVMSFDAGTATSKTLTQKQLDDALKAKGVADGAQSDLMWSVKATNGDVTILAQVPFSIKITRMKDGATPFVLLAPSSTTAPITINPNSTSLSFTFRWTKSKPATGGPAVSYKVLFSLDGNFSTPLFGINANAAPADSTATLTYKAMNDSLVAHGQTNLASPTALKWTVVATSGSWKQQADYVNDLVIIREVKLYLVGGSSPAGWNPPLADRLIEDAKNPGVFFIYAKMTVAGSGFKFLSENTDWSSPTITIYGDADGGGASGNLTTSGGGNNINVPADGIYRVTVDLNTMKYYLQTGASGTRGVLGLVGQFQTPSQWSPATAPKMTYQGVNRFIAFANMTNGDPFKFHDGNDWNNSGANNDKWFGPAGTNILKVDDGSLSNVVNSAPTGMMRAFFDASDVKNIKYSTTQGKIFLVGGDAALGGWNNSPSAALPEMTYLGNGKWTVTLTIGAASQFKFIVEKGVWGYQYGDNGGGTVKWRNGDSDPDGNNINISAGVHTITLDEYNLTYSIS